MRTFMNLTSLKPALQNGRHTIAGSGEKIPRQQNRNNSAPFKRIIPKPPLNCQPLIS